MITGASALRLMVGRLMAGRLVLPFIPHNPIPPDSGEWRRRGGQFAVDPVAKRAPFARTDEQGFAQPGLVECRPAVVFRRHALERLVVPLDGRHRVVDELADFRTFGALLQIIPASFEGHPEDVLAEDSEGHEPIHQANIPRSQSLNVHLDQDRYRPSSTEVL